MEAAINIGPRYLEEKARQITNKQGTLMTSTAEQSKR